MGSWLAGFPLETSLCTRLAVVSVCSRLFAAHFSPYAIRFDLSGLSAAAWLRQPIFFALLALVAGAPLARAVSCSTESQMTAAERDPIIQAARALGGEIQAANVNGVRQSTIAAVAAQFDPVAASIQAVSTQIQTAALTINGIYSLKASDLKGTRTRRSSFARCPARR